MKLKCVIVFIFTFLLIEPAWSRLESAMNIITYKSLGYTVDESAEQGLRVRRLLTRLQILGIDTVIFNFRGHMVTGYSNEVFSTVPRELWADEERELEKTVRFAQSLGLKVAFRPILLVIGPKGEFPYEENGRYWWHGVIRPTEPAKWFESYFYFHEHYLKMAAKWNVAWYSVGAEMHSLTSGMGSRDLSWRFGYPQLWTELLEKARDIVGTQVQLTYGINYTDQYVQENGERTWGGEFEQWRYHLVEKMDSPEGKMHQKQLRDLWRSLDFIGIDFYRALGSESTVYPKDFLQLSQMLAGQMASYEPQLSRTMSRVNAVTQSAKQLAIQEVGYRSVEKGFVSPYLYEDDKTPINYMHQAAAWQAFLNIIWRPSLSWFRGVGIWQVLVDEDADLAINGGFSPLGKDITEAVLAPYFSPSFKEGPALSKPRAGEQRGISENEKDLILKWGPPQNHKNKASEFF